MLENSTRVLTENLARAMDRRLFLKRTGETMFVALAALASGHVALAQAATGSGGSTSTTDAPRTPSCRPAAGT